MVNPNPLAEAKPRVTAQSCLRIVEAKSQGRLQTADRIRSIVRDWTAGKFPELAQSIENHSEFCIQNDKVHIKAGESGAGVWSFSCAHVDTDRPSWHWCTQVGLSYEGKNLMLALRNHWQGKPTEGSPQPSVPRILRTVIAQLIVQDLGGYRVRGQPSVLDDLNKFDEFVSNTISEDRMLPIVVLSELHGKNSPPYAVNIDKLATQLAGVAHVVCLPADGQREMNQEFGQSLTIYNGAVRIFEPGFAYSDEATQHALFLPPDDVRHGSIQAMRMLALRIESHILGRNRTYALLTKQAESILPPWAGF